ncbi:MAG TPA: hypothetical protein VOA78_14975 [Candidatus Dormibacteraeota bacterium]|nr:hypothetical protein [Candidatus Dormibacteraeota bacterium]
MFATSRWKAGLLLPLLCLAAPAFAQIQQTGDPVADAARKAQAAKKDAPKPKKVYTDENLPKAPRPTEEPAAAAPAATPDGQAPAAGAPGATGAAGTGDAATAKSEEETWRGRFKAQRDKIARAEKELGILQRETDKAQLQYYPDPQKALSEQNSRKDINEKDAKIAAKQKEIADLKLGLDDLEDQLKKAGGDSGWARE